MTTVEQVLAAVPEAQREPMRFMIEHAAKVREAYGLATPEGTIPEMPSLEEQKVAEEQMAKDLADRLLEQYGGTATLEDWDEHWYSNPLLNKRDLPYLAMSLVESRCLTYAGVRSLVERAWTLPEWPGQHPKAMWLRLFARSDFICTIREDGEVCDLHADEFDPTGDDDLLTLWRGAFESAKRGLSWTTDRDRAAWFAARGDMTSKGRRMHVYRVQAPREATLAHFNRRGEHEVVLDARGLRITKED